MNIKSKIRYLGEKNSLLPWKMTEKLTVEVYVKNRDTGGGGVVAAHLIYFVWIWEKIAILTIFGHDPYGHKYGHDGYPWKYNKQTNSLVKKLSDLDVWG